MLAFPAMRFTPLRAAFLFLLAVARQFPSLREDTHFAMTMPMPIVRRSLFELGRRLTDAGVLEDSEEVFHLRFDELERAATSWPPPAALAEHLESTARDRAERRAALAATPLVSLPPTTTTPAGDALLAGMPGSPGVAEGTARLIAGPAAFGRLQPGDVLVAPYTNPSWTPLFGRAAAVVVDTGSAMSHAAIVAREYDIPAVMGTIYAMTRLHDGQRVRVDGTRGLVIDVETASDLMAASGQRMEKTLLRE